MLKIREVKVMKQLGEFILGLVLFVVGIVIFLQNVVVNSFTLLYRMHNVSVGGILLILIFIAFITMMVKPNKITISVFAMLCIIFFVCLIISLNIRVSTISGLELVLILATIGVGIALMIRALMTTE
jgi:hypothetical protein